MRYFHPELMVFIGISTILIMLLQRYGRPRNMDTSFVYIFYGSVILSITTLLDYADSYLVPEFFAATFDLDVYRSARAVVGYLPGVILLGVGITRWFKLTAQLQAEIQARKTLELKLRGMTHDYKVAADNALASSRVKIEFVRQMSHELRTPLNAIIGFSEIMQKEMFGKIGANEYRDYLAHINQSGQRLLDTVNDVLDFSRTENHELTLAETDFNLVKTAAQALELMTFQNAKSGVKIAADFPGTLMMRADERMVQQMIFNLVRNAVQFSGRGSVVEVSAHLMPDNSCSLMVKDRGCGMTADEIGRVVNPFHQVTGGLTRSHEGVGLGLTLTKDFIELHGGEILIESEPNIGTSICLKFPKDRIILGLARSA